MAMFQHTGMVMSQHTDDYDVVRVLGMAMFQGTGKVVVVSLPCVVHVGGGREGGRLIMTGSTARGPLWI